MTDTATTETKRTRYSGAIALEDVGEEQVDTTTSGMGRGRKSIDLKPYEQVLAANYAKNSKVKEGNLRTARVFRINDEAVSTVKSRFNTAAANIGVGVTYSTEIHDDGMTTLKIVTSKRAAGRGRKPASNGQTAK